MKTEQMLILFVVIYFPRMLQCAAIFLIHAYSADLTATETEVFSLFSLLYVPKLHSTGNYFKIKGK